jgi:hypothetical protein
MTVDINEAYARIDYKMLKDLSEKINSVEEQLTKLKKSFSSIQGTFKDLENLSFFADRKLFNKNDKLEFSFGSNYKNPPVVTLTAENMSQSTDKNPYVTIIELTKDRVKFKIINAAPSTRVHCIAMGETD